MILGWIMHDSPLEGMTTTVFLDVIFGTAECSLDVSDSACQAARYDIETFCVCGFTEVA